MTGDLPAEAPLREQELCKELGISRTPLREAIRTLAREGLVRLQPNRSAIVAGLDVEAVADLYRAIGHIEALGARLACQAAPDEEISRQAIRHHEMEIVYHGGDLSAYIRLNAGLHRGQLALSGSAILLEMWEMLHPRVERARTAANLYPDRWHEALLEHRAMLHALSRRDADRLAELMIAHYDNGLATLRTRPGIARL